MQMTFLEICQRVAAESGTFGGATAPLTTANQTGRALKVVNAVKAGWEDLQLMHRNWLFMRKAFLKDLQQGTGQYSGATLSLTDVTRWLPVLEDDTGIYSVYDNSIGVADERAIPEEITWASYRDRYV